MRSLLPLRPRPVAVLTAVGSLVTGLGAALALTAAPAGPAPSTIVRAAASDGIRPFDPTHSGPERAVARARRRLAAAELRPDAPPAPEPPPEPPPEPEPPAHTHPPAPAPAAGPWDALARCESGGNWQSSVGTYEGGLQFHPGTWDAYRDAGMPAAAYDASREVQILVAERVLAEQGWSAWPACSRKLGLR